MPTRNSQNCQRYLDRIADLLATADGHKKMALICIARRLTRELQECEAEERLMQDLMQRRANKFGEDVS